MADLTAREKNRIRIQAWKRYQERRGKRWQEGTTEVEFEGRPEIVYPKEKVHITFAYIVDTKKDEIIAEETLIIKSKINLTAEKIVSEACVKAGIEYTDNIEVFWLGLGTYEKIN